MRRASAAFPEKLATAFNHTRFLSGRFAVQGELSLPVPGESPRRNINLLLRTLDNFSGQNYIRYDKSSFKEESLADLVDLNCTHEKHENLETNLLHFPAAQAYWNSARRARSSHARRVYID